MTDQTSSHATPTPKTAKKVSVGITAIELQSAPWFDYSMNANYHDKGGKQDHGTLIFDKNAGNFDIEFFLSDVPPGLMFRPTFAQAFGISPSPTCPAAGATVAGFDGRVSKDQSTLSLTNKNGGTGGSFQFALYFDGPYRDASHPPFPWDPKILNGGTGTFTDAVKIGIALAVVAIGAALFVALR